VNEPIRYTSKAENASDGIHYKEHPEGEFVKWSDYQILQSINRSFAENIQRLGNECRDMDREIKRLRSF
jgi:hypothetical protein